MDSREVDVAWVLANYRPGSQGDDWTWDDEERWPLEAPCICNTPRVGGIYQATPGARPCPTPGHYQLNLESHLRSLGRIEQPILLGSDGRVWDGHHRVVAARRLGITRIPIEV